MKHLKAYRRTKSELPFKPHQMSPSSANRKLRHSTNEYGNYSSDKLLTLEESSEKKEEISDVERNEDIKKHQTYVNECFTENETTNGPPLLDIIKQNERIIPITLEEKDNDTKLTNNDTSVTETEMASNDNSGTDLA